MWLASIATVLTGLTLLLGFGEGHWSGNGGGGQDCGTVDPAVTAALAATAPVSVIVSLALPDGKLVDATGVGMRELIWRVRASSFPRDTRLYPLWQAC